MAGDCKTPHPSPGILLLTRIIRSAAQKLLKVIEAVHIYHSAMYAVEPNFMIAVHWCCVDTGEQMIYPRYAPNAPIPQHLGVVSIGNQKNTT